MVRIVVPGLAHHTTQRENNQNQVFFADADYLLYLQLLKSTPCATNSPYGAIASCRTTLT